MKQNISKLILFMALGMGTLSLGLVGAAGASSILPSSLADTTQNEVCSGIGLGGACSNGGPETTKINNTIKNFINLLSVVVGIIAVVMVIFSGYKYITSAGDSSKIASAKTTLIYAIVGLIIVGLAQVIVKFVLSKTN